MRLLKAVPAFLMAVACAVSGASEVNAITVTGAPDCGSWVTNREAESVLSKYNEVWLIAYLSGIAIGASVEFWEHNGENLNPKQVFLWMDLYCQTNPLEHVSDGAKTLFLEVVSK